MRRVSVPAATAVFKRYLQMQSFNNWEVSRRHTFHFAWQPATANFRLMALLENGDVMLVRVASDPAELRQYGQQTAEEIDKARDAWLQLTKIGQPNAEAKPQIVSLYSEQWIGNATEGSWQPLNGRRGFYRGFRRLGRLRR